ncbi:hypothetical protein C8C83_1729 [Flavobacterium sp. 90]|uniref:hypothetical protein n=1 Tax=unclassified Flavobacterium TaxID=196869 RepID=UPI000F1C011A|nr:MULTISPECIES: hypothetical protein [unclassified Flavobacterium]RKR10061.1 hypothetical protein C8C82_2031 [Flavobacterium sp. 81]TCK53846.1 hypothetical protein C8C83_1729 [Flavobacterium sp. 90]
MKTNTLLFTVLVCVFSFNCFAQRSSKSAPVIAATGNAHLQPDNTSDGNDLVIESYCVEETINMTFGRRVTRYEVSKLDMVNTYDLGPNNTRTVTPIYKKPKVKTVEVGLSSKPFVDSTAKILKPVKVEVLAPSKKEKFVNINVVNTYEKIIDKGYKSLDMLRKVADKSYFDNDMETAAKYYAQLLDQSTDLDSIYYYRYAQSLKESNQPEKANEMMILFESKNLANQVAKK